jgi:hypothetical protein
MSDMTSTGFDTKRISEAPDAIAPDGSEVRLLCGSSRGGMATFSLKPGAVSKAVAHRTIEEVWYFIRGRGRLWRKSGDAEEITESAPASRSRSRPACISNSAATPRSRSKRSPRRCRPGPARAKPMS